MSTYRYVSEAHWHLREIYEQLLGASMESSWCDLRASRLRGVVDVLERYDVPQAITNWRGHAISFLRKTPSARDKQKFHDNDDRILFLCVALWYARAAVRWLEDRQSEGLLQGGVSYRAMTAQAADFGSRNKEMNTTSMRMLPEEIDIVDELDKADPWLTQYRKWTYFVSSDYF